MKSSVVSDGEVYLLLDASYSCFLLDASHSVLPTCCHCHLLLTTCEVFVYFHPPPRTLLVTCHLPTCHRVTCDLVTYDLQARRNSSLSQF